MAVDSSLNIILGATLGPLQRGLKKGAGLIKSFSASASKAITGGGMGSALAGALGGVTATAAIGYSLKKFSEIQQATTLLTSSLKANGAQAGVSTAQIKSYSAELLKTTGIAQTATLAAAAGLTRFQQVKGPNFQETITQAANYAAVMGGDLPAATAKLGEALQNPREGYLELAAAGVAFSDAQIDAIQSLQEGGDVAGAQAVILEALKAQYDGAAEAAGNTLSGSLDKLWGSFAQIAAIVGEAVAPAIQAAVGMFHEWLAGIDQQAAKAAVFDFVAKSIGVVVDTVQVLNLAWKAAQVAVDGVVLVAVKGFKWIVIAVEKVIAALELIPGTTKSAGDAVRGFLADIEQFEGGLTDVLEKDAGTLVDAWQKPWESKKAGTFFQDVARETKKSADAMGMAITGPKGPVAAMRQLTKVQIEAQSEATKLVKALGMQNDNFGLDDWQAKGEELRAKGATPAQVAQVTKLGAELQGKELAESLETPFEKFEREMKKLTALREAGGIDAGPFDRATASLTRGLIDAAPVRTVQAGGALAAGSQEARSALLSYRNAARGSNPQELIRRIAEKQLEETKQGNDYLRQLARPQAVEPAFPGL